MTFRKAVIALTAACLALALVSASAYAAGYYRYVLTGNGGSRVYVFTRVKGAPPSSGQWFNWNYWQSRSLLRYIKLYVPSVPPGQETGTPAPSNPGSLSTNQGSGSSLSQQPATPQTQPAPGGLTEKEKLMVELVNQERARLGLQPLEVDMRLVELARMKSQDMIDKGYFAHTSPTYGSPFDMMKAAGVDYRVAGENLAGAPTVESAHNALMQSDGHRRNILNPEFDHIGIGIVEGGPYGLMVTQMFTGSW